MKTQGFLNLSGQVNQCPGRVDETTIFTKDIRKEKSLGDVWKRSLNYQRAKDTHGFNYHCVARDGRSLPADFYHKIQNGVLKHFGEELLPDTKEEKATNEPSTAHLCSTCSNCHFRLDY